MIKHFIVFLVFMFYATMPAQNKPSWIVQRPAERGYIIGIVSVAKTGSLQEYMQRAKDAALNEIAQQITVTINAEQMSKLSEKLGQLSGEYQMQVRTSTSAELDGVETVDTWDGEAEYWVYYRLSIETYQKIRAEKIEKAKLLALDFYNKAKISETKGNIPEAFQSYLQAMSSIAKYITEPLEVQYANTKIRLSIELISSFQSLLNKIELKSLMPKIETQVGTQVKHLLEVKATNVDNGKPLINLPIRYSFIRGSGDILATVKTNKDGIASSQIMKITGTDKLQIVKAETDVLSVQGNSGSNLVFETLLKSFTLPSTRIMISVSNLAVFFDVQEMLLGKPLQLPRIEPIIKENLSSQGFSFVDDVSKANIMITIKANGRDGGEYQGFYTVYVDVQISVIDLKEGNEVYKTSCNNIKGVSISYDKAGLKAYDEIADKVKNEILPALLERLRK